MKRAMRGMHAVAFVCIVATARSSEGQTPSKRPYGAIVAVERVVIDGGKRLRIVGTFAMHQGQNAYGLAQAGSMYFACPPDREEECAAQWSSFEEGRRTFHCLGFGWDDLPAGRVAEPTDEDTTPDVFPLLPGTHVVEESDPVCAELIAARRRAFSIASEPIEEPKYIVAPKKGYTGERDGLVFDTSLGWMPWKQFGVPINLGYLRIGLGGSLRQDSGFAIEAFANLSYLFGRTASGRSLAGYTSVGGEIVFHYDWVRAGVGFRLGELYEKRASNLEWFGHFFSEAHLAIGIEPFEYRGMAAHISGTLHKLGWGEVGSTALGLVFGVRWVGPEAPVRPPKTATL